MLAAWVAVATACKVSSGVAQVPFPNGPIRLLFPAQPGGAGDASTRALCAAAARELGQPVIQLYRPGAAATLPAQDLVEARPDGHTLAIMPISAFRLPLVAPALARFNPLTDFTWIIQLAGLLVGIVVRADAPWHSFRAFLDHARANPGRITYGIPGANTTELPLEVIARGEGIDWTAVPFRSGPETLNALLGGHLDAIADTSAWLPYVERGQLRLLAVYGTERNPRFPDVPTLQEFGIDWVVDFPTGLAGPAGMRTEIVKALHDAFRTALFDPTVLELIERAGSYVRYLNSEDYALEAQRLFHQERSILSRLGRLG
jgi:tripartite-type tricarboxylate transporter receptor subunit TctC